MKPDTARLGQSAGFVISFDVPDCLQDSISKRLSFDPLPDGGMGGSNLKKHTPKARI